MLAPADANTEAQFSSSASPPSACPSLHAGRLPIELACQGFDAQGNEFNYYLLLTSSFFMNNDVPRGYFEAYPWVLQTW